jgi:septum formation protein
MLSGKTHEVLTAVVLTIDPKTNPLCLVQVSEVEFAHLSKEQIASYIGSGEPFGKAGAYGIQGLAASFIAGIKGSYSGIMGLPIFEVSQLLAHAKVARI